MSNSSVVLEPLALSNFNGFANLYFDSPTSPRASLSKRNLDWTSTKFSRSAKVRVETLDEYIKSNNLIPHVLQIDAEGHDLNVLLGCLKYIQQMPIVMFEFGGANKDTKTFFMDFYTFFSDLGFVLFRFTPYGIYEISDYSESDENFQTTNYIALKPI